MKTEKKIFAICLALAAALLLAGCGDPNGAGNGNGTIAVESISLSKTEKDLEPGDEFELTATIYPSDAGDQTVIWATSDEDVATVDGTGLTVTVRAAASGEAIITVTIGDGGKTAQCTVRVTIPPPPAISAKAIVKTQPNAGSNATSASNEFFGLEDGQWIGEKTLAGHNGTVAGNGTARTTLLYIKEPMTAAYTFRAKISFPASLPGNILFGEFIDPEAQTLTGGTSFQNSPASGNPSATNPGYKGLAGIRCPGATSEGAVTANAYGWVNEYATLAAGTLSTLIGALKPWTAESVINYSMTGFVPDTVHTFELSWSISTGYVYKITTGETTYTIPYPVTDLWATFETRPVAEPIYPGIMIYNTGSIV